MSEDRAERHLTLRVMTWNIHGAARPDLLALTRAIADADPDLIALQEVRKGQAARVADLLGIQEMRWLLKHRALGFVGSRGAEGIAVPSRFPVRAQSTTLLDRAAPLRSHRRRVMLELVVATAAGPVRIVNLHLSSDDDEARAREAARASLLLSVPTAGIGIDRTLVRGDLNTPDADDVVGAFSRLGLVDAWLAVPGGLERGSGHTNPADVATQRLDHILTGHGEPIAS